ncbi:MAG: hypothetical protein AOA66_1728 [Candidatus Bathyarchaeota archaeon BA2]|nr:MAG: hypothetical protein AOA66_1728 [Candidatus Bathyarchaeota archaeon BA2]
MPRHVLLSYFVCVEGFQVLHINGLVEVAEHRSGGHISHGDKPHKPTSLNHPQDGGVYPRLAAPPTTPQSPGPWLPFEAPLALEAGCHIDLVQPHDAFEAHGGGG